VGLATGTPGLGWRRAIDDLLEATVLLSWSRVGFLARKALWEWGPSCAPAGSLRGSNVVITGGTNGLGKAAAIDLVRAGAQVCLIGRDPARARSAVGEVNQAARVGAARNALGATSLERAGQAWAETADISSRGETAELAGRLLGRLDRLDALLHAAGGILHHYGTTEDGIERTVATHVVGPHLLTALMQPLLQKASPSIVVWVSSGGAYLQPLDVGLLRSTPLPYRGTVAYARAKRAQIALAHLWARQMAPQGTACTAMHPGWAATEGLLAGLPTFTALLRPILRTPPEGADTLTWLAAGQAGRQPEVALWLDRRARPEHKLPISRYPAEEEAELWGWCREVTGVPAGAPEGQAA
jgi:dehydrogenase/reductase SDR family protein 12